MKKLLVLVAVLALVAAMIAPMAAFAANPTVEATGLLPSTPSLQFTAPSGGISFGSFVLDRNPAGTAWDYTPNPGSVTLNPGILTDASWTLTASSAGFGDNSGRMWSDNTNRYLTAAMYITFNGTDFVQLPTVLSMTGTASQSGIYLQAAQFVDRADAIAGYGTYYIIVSLSCTPNF
jgi:hypothetical protein